MTPLQLAQAECANHENNGVCLGMDNTAGGRTVPLWPKKMPLCVLAGGQPCSYFETAILAGITMINNERKAMDWQEATDIYNERKHQYDLGSGKGSLERAGNDGTARLHKEAVAAAHAGGRTPGGQIGARILRLSGCGRGQMARSSQIGSRCDRNSSRRPTNYPLSHPAKSRHARSEAGPYGDRPYPENGVASVGKGIAETTFAGRSAEG